MTVLEFGSGRSTAWYASKTAKVVSIEHDAAWHKRVSADLAGSGRANVDYRFVPLDHPESEPERQTYSPLPKYVMVTEQFPDNTFDLVVIDGHYRSFCIKAALSKIKPGGLILVDNAGYWPNAKPPVPADWPEVCRADNRINQTVIYQRPQKS